MKITDNIFCVGVNDRDITLFEGQFAVSEGMAYNSYAIVDEKVAILDTVDAAFKDEWLANVASVLGGRAPDYLVVHHAEPDHSANIIAFAERYPEVKIVASAMAFTMLENLYGNGFADRKVVASEGFKLELGKHSLTFIAAPNVHWPEVLVSYEEHTKTLFSADGFGKFGASDVGGDWACEARRYYFGIVGRFGAQVQALLKKAAKLDIERICSLHGPVLDENIGYYINLYDVWSSYRPESEGVLIAYTSVYGHTKAAAERLCELLLEKGCKKVVLSDLATEDMAEVVEDAFRYDRMALATTTYNGDIFPYMKTFIEALAERNYSNRRVALIENGLWAPTAAKVMRAALENFKNVELCENTVRIKGALKEVNEVELEKLAEELCK